MINYEEEGKKLAKDIVKMDKSITKKQIMAKIKLDAYNKNMVKNGK
jgi:hypothetical protein|tara:strand:- start:127 stop:264 length:138 start_codon:yes stop_codon:yes gene_type:complete